MKTLFDTMDSSEQLKKTFIIEHSKGESSFDIVEQARDNSYVQWLEKLVVYLAEELKNGK